MKSLVLLTLSVFLFSSCGVKTTIDPTSKQKVKIFENNDFTLHYPTHWTKLYHKYLESGVVVGFSDKKDIIYPQAKKSLLKKLHIPIIMWLFTKM